MKTPNRKIKTPEKDYELSEPVISPRTGRTKYRKIRKKWRGNGWKNHAKKGSIIASEPIRDPKDIQKIINAITSKRDMALFIIGINTAFRAKDLCAITAGDVRNLTQPGNILTVRESKTGKIRKANLNKACLKAIDELMQYSTLSDDEQLFTGDREGDIDTYGVIYLMKKWCRLAGINPKGMASHTLRKTFGYHQRVTYKTDITVIMRLLNHSSQQQTMVYLGIQAEEIEQAYSHVIGGAT